DFPVGEQGGRLSATPDHQLVISTCEGTGDGIIQLRVGRIATNAAMSDQDYAISEQNRRSAAAPSHVSGRGECPCGGIVNLGAGKTNSSRAAPCVRYTIPSGDQNLAVGKERGRVPAAKCRHIASRREASRRRIVQFCAGKNRWSEEAAAWCLASGDQN